MSSSLSQASASRCPTSASPSGCTMLNSSHPRPALPPVSFSVSNTAIHPISKVEAQELSMTSFLPLTSQSDQMLSVLLSILQSISSSLPSPLETKPQSSLTYITHRLLATPCPLPAPCPTNPNLSATLNFWSCYSLVQKSL